MTWLRLSVTVVSCSSTVAAEELVFNNFTGVHCTLLLEMLRFCSLDELGEAAPALLESKQAEKRFCAGADG